LPLAANVPLTPFESHYTRKTQGWVLPLQTGKAVASLRRAAGKPPQGAGSGPLWVKYDSIIILEL